MVLSKDSLAVLLQALILIFALTSFAYSYEIDTTKAREEPDHHTSLGRKFLQVPQFVVNLPLWTAKGVGSFLVNDIVESQPVSRLIASFLAVDRVWGFYPVAGYGSNSSLKGGLAFTSRQVFTKGERIKTKGSYSINDYQDYQLRYSVPSKFRPFSDASITFRYRQRPRENLYGIGNGSRQENEVAFNLEESFVDLGWFHDLRRGLRMGLSGSYRAVNIFDGEDPGLEGSISRIRSKLNLDDDDTRSTRVWSAGVCLIHDWRNSRGQPTAGGYEFVSLSYNTELDRSDRLKYVTARANLYRFLNIYKKRLIALRVVVEATNPVAGSTELPFYLLRRLGGEDNLSGYRSSRFLDRNLAMISVEYRYPIWESIDAYVFLEEGRVFESFKEDLSLRNWYYSTGIGLRVWSQFGLLLQTRAAFSEEGAQFYLQLSEEL